uniref:LAGLIDADG_2 domain-containing protein n=1 Tax=Bursaphelenchus xylophilus TaxID=6326 RepID=A0A1I7RYN2_BURXY
MISRCLAKVGVYPVDTRDKLGRERFHHFHIDEFKSKYLVEFIKQNSFYGYKKFPEAISDTTVSFHHLTPYEMKVMDYLLNQLERKRGKLDASVLTSGRSIFSFLS